MAAFDDVYRVTPKLALAEPAKVDALERWLGAPLPRGYRSYVTTLGQGSYCNLVHVLLPQDVQARCKDKQAFVSEYFEAFWGGNGTLALDEAAHSVPFAHTHDGDEVLYSRERQRLFVLPRHDSSVRWIAKGFDDPLDWGASKNPLPGTDGGFRYFDSHIDRHTVELFTAKAFKLDDVGQDIARRWRPTHRMEGAWGMRIFMADIHGHVQLTQAPDDVRVGIRLEFDAGCAAQVGPLLDELAAQGFYVTRRHPS